MNQEEEGIHLLYATETGTFGVTEKIRLWCFDQFSDIITAHDTTIFHDRRLSDGQRKVIRTLLLPLLSSPQGSNYPKISQKR